MTTAVNMQIVTPSLTALLEHPDFQRGVADAEECFEEEYKGTLTEEQMITEVEVNLTRAATEQNKEWFAETFGSAPPSYIRTLGFVFGTINQGLAYTPAPC